MPGVHIYRLLFVALTHLIKATSSQENGYNPWMCLDMKPFTFHSEEAPLRTMDCGPRLVSMDKLPVVSAILNVTSGPYVSHHRKAFDLRLNKINKYTQLSEILLDLKLSKNKSSEMAKEDYALQEVIFEDFLQKVDSTFADLREIRAFNYLIKANVHKRLDLAKFYRYEIRGDFEEEVSAVLSRMNLTDLHDAARSAYGLIREFHTDKIYCDWLNRSRDPRLTANESPCLTPDHLMPKMKSMRSSMDFEFELIKMLVDFEAKEAKKKLERANKWSKARRKQYGRVRNGRRKLKRNGGTISRLRNMHTIARYVLHNITSSSKISKRGARNLRKVQRTLEIYQELQDDLKNLYDKQNNFSIAISACPDHSQTIPSLMRDARSSSLKLQDRKSDLDDVISYNSKMAASIREHTRLFAGDIQLRMRRLTNIMTFAQRYVFVLDGLHNVTEDVREATRDTRNATKTLKELQKLLNSVVVYIPPPTTITTTTPAPTTTPTSSTTAPTTTSTTFSAAPKTTMPTTTVGAETDAAVTSEIIDTTPTDIEREKTTKRLEVFTTAPKIEYYTDFWGNRFSRIATKPTPPQIKTTPKSTTPLMTDSTVASTKRSTSPKMRTLSTTETTPSTTTVVTTPSITSTAATATSTTFSTTQRQETTATTMPTIRTTTSAPVVPDGYEIQYDTDFWGNRITRLVKITTPGPSTILTPTIATTAGEDIEYSGSGDMSETITLPDYVETSTEEETTIPTTASTPVKTTTTMTTAQTESSTAPTTTTTEATSPYTGDYETYTNFWGETFTRHITRPTTLSTTPTTTEAAGFWNGRRRKREIPPDVEVSLQFTTDFWKRYYKKLNELNSDNGVSPNDDNSTIAKVREKRAWFWEDENETTTTETIPTIPTTFSTTPSTKVTPLWPMSTHSRWPTSLRISTVDDNGDIITTSTVLPELIVGSDYDVTDDDIEGSGEDKDVAIVTLAPPGIRNATIKQTVWQLRQDLQNYLQRSQADVLEALRRRSSTKELAKKHSEIITKTNLTEPFLENLTSTFSKMDLGNLTSLEPRLTSLTERHDDVMKRMDSLRDAAAEILEKMNHTRWRLREVRHMIHVSSPGDEVKNLQTKYDEHNFIERKVWAKHRQVEALANSIKANFSQLREMVGNAMKNVNSIQPVFSVEPGSSYQTRLPYDIIVPSLTSTIQMHLRTLSPDGTFFSITDPRLQSGQARRIQLSIVDGRPLAEWRDSSFVTNMTTRRPINDGNWHTIKLDKVGRSWTMTEFLSPHREAAITASTSLPFWSMVDYSPHMFIWSSPELQPAKNDPRYVDFKACLTNVVMNGKVITPRESSFNLSSGSECHSTSQFTNIFKLSREITPLLLGKNHCLAKHAQTLMLPYDVTNDTMAFSFRSHDNHPGTLLMYTASNSDLFVVGVANGHVMWEGRIRGQSFRRMCYELYPGDNVWHHVVIVFEADATSLYVDNRICATINMAVMATSTRSPMMFIYTAYRGRLVSSLPSRQPLMRFHGDIKHLLYNNRLFPVHQSYPCGRGRRGHGYR